MITRRHFLRQLGLGVAGLTLAMTGCATGGHDSQSSKHRPPNILFTLGDDHTTQAITCYGGMLAELATTKNIDRIAAKGVKLNNYFCTNSICSPSRATILTGQYSHRNGVRCLDQAIDEGSVTFPKLFRQAGYQTALCGKWHLKSRPQGFDDYKVLKRQGRYQDPQFAAKGRTHEDMETIPGWSTDVIADLTMDYIRQRDKTRPFLVLCQFKATHDPWDSREPAHAKVVKNLKQRLLALRKQYKDTDEPYPEMQDVHARYWNAI